jgi:Putative lumazine-binding
MRPFPALAALVLLAIPRYGVAAQSTTRDSVLATLQQAFDQMRSRDTAGMRQLFDSTARLIGIRDTTTAIRPRTVSQFLASVASTPAERASDERMFDPEVRIEGPVAQVWTYYTFRSGTTFSHCGTDAVTLIRSGGAWKIASFVWTVRTERCSHRE